MKKQFLTAITLVSFLTISIVSCSDDDTTPNNGANQPASGFTWTENGGATITADSAYYESRYKTIKAYKGENMEQFIEINLSADAPATYAIGSGYAVSKLDASGIYAASSGEIKITAKDASKMSGTITSAGSGSDVNALDAQFNNIEVR